MLGATFPASDPSKMRLLLALMTRAHLFSTSCSASHVKCTCCGVSWDTGGGGRFLAPFHCHLTFLKSFHLPENLNSYRSPLPIYSVFLLLFPVSCAIVSPRPFLMLHSLNTHLVHTDSVTRIVPGPRDTETILLPGRKNRTEYIFWDLRMWAFENVPVTFIKILPLNLICTLKICSWPRGPTASQGTAGVCTQMSDSRAHAFLTSCHGPPKDKIQSTFPF